MRIRRLLMANRGEIAIRVMRAAAEMGIETVAVYPADDERSLHTRKADEARLLPGAGAAAYLDVAEIVRAAVESECDALHPGYGFLSESAALARACAEAGVVFVGPRPEVLDLFGDKVQARALAERAGAPILRGTNTAVSLDEARAFLDALSGAPMILKARAGGGGRGVRVVRNRDELESAYTRASSEAKAAFGNGDLYVEELVKTARHIEVQVAGDATGAVMHLGERDCSLQRRHQKVLEIAPAPGLPPALRERITATAVALATEAGYNNVGTFEFLVDSSNLGPDSPFAFIEANARLQVEHTVTEEVTGVDLVRLQLLIAGGGSLTEAGLAPERPPAPRGFAIQARINMETMRPDGMAMPASGTLTAFEPPPGPGVRVDSFGYAGYQTSARYDSLLAKLIGSTPSGSFEDALTRTARALGEFRIEGVSTNVPFLQRLLAHPDVRAGRLHTRFIDEHGVELASPEAAPSRRLFFDAPSSANGATSQGAGATHAGTPAPGRAGVTVDANDPLAVLAYGQAARDSALERRADAKPAARLPEGSIAIEAPIQGTVVSIDVAEGDPVRPGQQLAVMESMKMEHAITAQVGGMVGRVAASVGDIIYPGHVLLVIEVGEVEHGDAAAADEVDLDAIRPDLDEVLTRRATTLDEQRPAAVARRRRTGQRTARENVDDLCDPGSFVEYGPLVLAAQSSRRSLEELIEKSPADGMITGVGTVNGDLFPEPASRVVVMSYDYTVFAGTQGQRNHAKTDRLVEVARETMRPLVLFAEGGGGRPGDDARGSGSRTFAAFPRLSGLVPMVGITSGRCYAGNASLLGCCDVIIATANSNIGMGGPAMIEGGGLGVFAPEDIGPLEVQVANGVVDIAVADEAEAVHEAKRYLSYFQGSLTEWEEPDQREMRRIVPENRLRVYDIRRVIETLADRGSVLELRKGFGHGMVTSLIRVEGRPLGVVANNPAHLGGAIDSDAADKGARFLQICDAFDIPVLFFCDTPGIMVGPEVEKTALVRHANRMFIVGSNLSVPFFTVILRKAYGLGAIAMAGGSYKMPQFTVAWPTGEFAGMGIEGSIKLGFRDELAAIEDPAERRRKYEEMVARAYERGKAIHRAADFGIDDTIDPAETRRWVARGLRTAPPAPPRTGKKRPHIDAW